jgi:hypothetical protein
VFSRFTRFAMGDGSKIRFWHDVWHRDQALMVAVSGVIQDSLP